MKIEKRPYQPMPTRTYCSGVMTKNAQKSVMWSARRVGVSVTNSRRARKESRPKSTTEPMPPVASESENTAAISHQARMREFMLATVARPLSPRTVRARIAPVTEATTSRPSTPPNAHNSSRSRVMTDAA